jgi:hypothetical protein
MKFKRLSIHLGLIASMIGAPALAHDFIVKPGAGGKDGVDVSVMVTELYIQPDRMPPDTTELRAIRHGKAESLALRKDEQGKVMKGVAATPAEGGLLLAGRAERFREARPGRGEAPFPEGVAPILMMEMFSKAYVSPARGAVDLYAPLGDRIEIIPMSDLATLSVGDTLVVKILFEGAPLATRVLAAVDGSSDKKHDWAARTESGEDGLAHVVISRPGLWLVRAKVILEEDADDHQRYEGSTNIVFTVDQNAGTDAQQSGGAVK